MIFALCVTFLALVLCIVAFIKGGAPEKWGAVTFVLAWALTPLVDMQHGIRFGVLIVDSLALVSFILISVKWRQIWSLLAATFQLLDVVCHLAMAISPHIGAYGYLTGLIIWGGYGLMATMAMAIWECNLDRKYAVDVPKR